LYQKEEGATFCLPCLTGEFQDDAGSPSCKPCRIGSSNGLTAQQKCVSCIPGKFQDKTNQPSCKNCVAGMYSKVSGATADTVCLKCRKGTYSTTLGADTDTACAPCAPGKWSGMDGALVGSACKKCTIGMYSPDEASTSCTSCPSGYTSLKEGLTLCEKCIGGEYLDSATKQCKTCKPGSVSKSGAVECKTCPNGQTTNDDLTACNKCDSGRYGDTSGCHDCVAGEYQDGKGETHCKRCAIDTYLTESGKKSNADCLKCPDDRSTGTSQGNTAESACLCKRTDFYTDTEGACISCSVGADCSAKDGLVLSELTAEPGYWRPSLDSDIFSPCAAGYSTLNADDLANARCCPVVDDAKTNISICVRNSSTSTIATFSHTDEQCSNGYSGSLCLVCAAGFVKQGTDCIACPEGASIGIAAIPLISMLAGLFVVLLIFLVCGKKAQNKAEKANKWFGQAKIMLSFLQIFSSMPGVLDGVPWPKPFLEFALPLGLANLDFLSVLAKTGCSLNVRFYDKFILHMIFPVGCLIIILLAYFVAVACCVKKDDAVRQSSVKQTASKAVILVVLLLYPGLST